ncbi:unnamed protein product [Symbiodinium sp. CCMP2592]|nr:unnamed protein product [Symbiodinium sp. CCMP2592]
MTDGEPEALPALLNEALVALADQCKVPPDYHGILAGFDVSLFGCIAADSSALDEALKDLLEGTVEPPSTAQRLLLLSSLRLLYETCRQQSSASRQGKRQEENDITSGLSTSSWSEQFPPKLSGERVMSLQKQFHARYPGEILDPDNYPSARLLAYVAKVIQKGELRWIPWKIRMSQAQQDSLALRRPAKVPRLEELIYDDVPQREIPAGAVGANYLSGILGLVSVAVAMLQGAHLASLRKFERKFIKLATQKCEAGIRNPFAEEIMQADRQLWCQMADLVNLHGWSLDDALTEYTEIRGDMASLLQSRVAVPKKFAIPPGLPRLPGGKGKQKGGGKGRGANGGQSGQTGAKWITKFEDKGKTRLLCRDYSSAKGCSFTDCKFEHLCPVPRPDGRFDAAELVQTSSQQDLDWETCLSVLQQHCPGSTQLLRTKVLQGGRNHASYFNAGVRSGSLGGLCRFTLENPKLVEYVNLFLQSVFPDGTWSSFCISHNEFAHIHSDFNAPGSLNHSCSLGAFDKGGLWIQVADSAFPEHPRVPPTDAQADQTLRGCIFNTRRSGISFDGALPHCSEPWTGDRWVLTAYTSAQLPGVSASEMQQLRDLHFPLPDSSCQTAASALSGAGILPAPPSVLDLSKVRGNLFLDLFAGHARPLSSAFLQAGVSVLSVDTMLASEHDLLDDSVFEPLLRLSFSGAVTSAHASPPCREYSRCKLIRPGPKPLRTPEHLAGIPGLSSSDQERVAASRTLMERAVELLHATYKAGGHFSLENPANSMLWLEEAVRILLQKANADVLVVAACAYGWDISKRWAFATSFRDMQRLAKDCSHAEGSHRPVAGVRDESGGYASQQTSEFPAKLAEAYVSAALPLFSTCENPLDVQLSQLYQLIPAKGRFDMPFAHQDGAGIYSVPDWSFPPNGTVDRLQQVRHALTQKLFELKAPIRLREHVQAKSDSPLFSEGEIASFRAIFSEFLVATTGRPVDWSVQPFQPYTLNALQQLSEALEDPDDTLFACLQSGAPTGYFKDIPRSGVFVPAPEATTSEEQPLLECQENWKGARENPETLESLIQEELDNGYLEEVTLEEARSRWPEVAVGKLNVVIVPDKNPRLTVDETISGVNPACHIPERYNLPGLGDLQSSYPLRGQVSELRSFSLDIKAAHKSILMQERDPYWWQRLSGFFMRTWHLLVFLAHFMSMYVDDLILAMASGALDISACLLLAFAAAFGIRLSWPKLQLGSGCLWIGWQLSYRAGTVRVPQSKREKLRGLLNPLLVAGRVELKLIQQALGLLQWITQLHKELRPWLSSLYDDISRPPGTSFSIEPSRWGSLAPCLSDAMVFISTPAGTAIPVGSKLLSARHIELWKKSDLAKVPLTSKRVWMRIAAPQSRFRRLSVLSRRLLQFWFDWCGSHQFHECLMLPQRSLDATMAADACAQGTSIGIGGFITLPGSDSLWFSERFDLADFKYLELPLHSESQKDISCWETLAQVGLMLLFGHLCPGGRMRICVPSFCDSSGAESICAKLLTTKSPLCFFTQLVAMISTRMGISLEVQHIAGERNTDADFLSRWDGVSPLPAPWNPDFRYRFTVADFFDLRHDVRLFPADAKLLWKLPR